ncbi:hypothetical protein C474_18154 [Halogeometricum pallidum JCM 14848]|uniref:DUF7314 domain-containing protein n=1 Tax=Halogeometricum pallidum JCM 14848 TaxID=1227487 RepID=M0CVP7_HALPD|nr:hypothetical protein [Halogeometricum pallidum]ELZ27295.1 hypothetical protein C474_18154 [Halogeometricum pallidum JCM 14848]
MADEFIKGLGIVTAAGLGWLVLAGWYRTSSFESSRQLIESASSGGSLFDAMGIALMDGLLYFALIGMLTFWVLIPAGRQARSAIRDRRSQ